MNNSGKSFGKVFTPLLLDGEVFADSVGMEKLENRGDICITA